MRLTIASNSAVGDEGAFQHQDLGLAGCLVQHVARLPKPRLQAHHPAFAQAESIGGFVTWLKFWRK
jgi:hypothetical protein